MRRDEPTTALTGTPLCEGEQGTCRGQQLCLDQRRTHRQLSESCHVSTHSIETRYVWISTESREDAGMKVSWSRNLHQQLSQKHQKSPPTGMSIGGGRKPTQTHLKFYADISVHPEETKLDINNIAFQRLKLGGTNTHCCNTWRTNLNIKR